MLAIIVILIQLWYDPIMTKQIHYIIISSWIDLIFIMYDYMYEVYKYILQLIRTTQWNFVNIVVVLFLILFDDVITNQKHSINPNIIPCEFKTRITLTKVTAKGSLVLK